MPSTVRKPRIVREPVEITIGRLETYVARMEHRYECESSSVAEAVGDGTIRETAEISRWLTNYWTLKHLREAAGAGRTTGTRTTPTR
jgi:hypothetical protein